MSVPVSVRWAAVVPGALLAVVAANFLLHWSLVATLNSETIQSPVAPVEKMLLPFAAAIAFVWAGVYIAPSHKLIAGISLAVALLALWSLYLFGVFAS